MTDKYEALKKLAERIASELDDHNANLDRKARTVIRELILGVDDALAERDALATKLAEMEKQEPVAWLAFADSNGPVPLELYGWDEKACKHAVLTNARAVGWKGTVEGYLMQMGWAIKPVYLTPGANPDKQDAERLDWIQRNLFGHKWNGVIDSGSRTYWDIWTGYRHITATMVGDTFREAIDAAIDAAEAQPVGINGLTEAETSATMSVMGLSKPAQPEAITCACGRTHKRTAYGWASNEPAQPLELSEPADDVLVAGVKAMRLFVTKNSVADFKLGYMAALSAANKKAQRAA